ncbi:MAG: hypothetical protein ISN26_02390 [Betaproteobacteria bacterium AqS2]|uniref:Uncharacterized protein n=1 Tax=Candidatus Amphirhobacter heronislandensis TaxID=1732024 RepID=A0A930UFW2_9GAMM|nr:hypothetical protein [Betaproteobacteria bacterium AqS2]
MKKGKRKQPLPRANPIQADINAVHLPLALALASMGKERKIPMPIRKLERALDAMAATGRLPRKKSVHLDYDGLAAYIQVIPPDVEIIPSWQQWVRQMNNEIGVKQRGDVNRVDHFKTKGNAVYIALEMSGRRSSRRLAWSEGMSVKSGQTKKLQGQGSRPCYLRSSGYRGKAYLAVAACWCEESGLVMKSIQNALGLSLNKKATTEKSPEDFVRAISKAFVENHGRNPEWLMTGRNINRRFRK